MLRMLPEALRVEFAADRTLALTDLLLALMAAGAIGLGLFPQILIYR
jgi:hypothetical protein